MQPPPVPLPSVDATTAVHRVGMEALPAIRALNRTIFGEERVINTFEREDVRMYLATVGGEPCAFKVGYCERPGLYYSAKGGVLAAHRRRGIARQLLDAMEDDVRAAGYEALAFDTFPNRDPGMAILGLIGGYRVVGADFNPTYRDYRIRFERRL